MFQGSLKRTLVVLTLSLALGFGGLYLVAGAALFDPQTYHVENASVSILAVCVGTFLAAWLMPAIRVRLLCLNQNIAMAYSTALLVHLLTVFGAVITPSNLGGPPAAAAVLNRVGVSLGKSIGVVLQIFILDLLFFAWVVPLSLWYLIYSKVVELPTSVEVAALAVATLALAGAVALGRYPRPIAGALLLVAKWRLLKRLNVQLRSIARDYYRSSRSYRKMPPLLRLKLNAVTAVHWIAMFGLLWGLLKLYGTDLNLLVTLALLNVLTLVSHLVPTPGGAGFVEAAVGLSVGPYAAGSSIAAALLIWRLIAFYVIFPLGPLAGWLLLLSPRADGGARKRG